MFRKRPCRICKKWFLPHSRAGDRQKVCSSVACQRERHRKACANWRQRNPDYDRDDRLRKRLQCKEKKDVVQGRIIEPLRTLNLSAVRDAVGLEVYVVIEEISKVLLNSVRDAVLWQLYDNAYVLIDGYKRIQVLRSKNE